MSAYVFLNPDGTTPFGLIVVVRAEGGALYAHQCGGLNVETRTVNGFAVPLGRDEAPLVEFFSKFGGYPPSEEEWLPDQLEELSAIIEKIPMWLTRPVDDDERRFLALDKGRAQEATEGWIPVETPYGKGVVVFSNSD